MAETVKNKNRVPGVSMLRFFSVASAACIIVAAIILCAIYRHFSVRDLVRHGERQNLALAMALANSLWPDYDGFEVEAEEMSPEELQKHPRTIDMDRAARRRLEGLPILKVNLYSLSGKTLYSTDPGVIGQQKPDTYPGKIVARTGKPISTLKYRNTIRTVHGNRLDRWVVSTYLPIKDTYSRESAAVFEAYIDVTDDVEDIGSTQITVFMAVTAILSVLWVTLLMVAQRAQHIIRMQSRALSRYIEEIENAKELLERRVDERTRALQTTVSALAEHRAELEHQVNVRTQELAKACDNALESSRAKSTFLANMSHELRTPLNAIIGYSEMLREQAVESQSDMIGDLTKIATAGGHLLQLINNILDLSKIEAGRVENVVEDIDLGRLMLETVESFAVVVQRSGNRLHVEIDPNLGTMRSDAIKLRQILFNLLGNANKFTSNGDIHFRAAIELYRQERWLVVEVADTGIGMTQDQVRRLFQKFYQADDSATRKYGGTGLGLAISRRLADLLGGTISVASEVNRGSTFSIRLPYDSAIAPSERVITGDVFGPKIDPVALRLHNDKKVRDWKRKKVSTIMFIDNEAEIRDLAERYFSRKGFHVITAATADEGLFVARARMPDAIVMDLMLSERNGLSALNEIKRDPKLSRCPVVITTLVNERDMCMTLGANEYLNKPIDWAILEQTLLRLIRQAAQQARDEQSGGIKKQSSNTLDATGSKVETERSEGGSKHS